MLCKNALKVLSEYYDEELDAARAVQVSQHLDQCPTCRQEFDSLAALHKRLKLLRKIQAPDHLRRLIQLRLTHGEQESLRVRIANDLERRWSKIRTTEGMWYLTRVMGTVMTTIFVILISSLISSAITPYYFNSDSPMAARAAISASPEYKQQIWANVLRRLGMIPIQNLKRPIDPTEPMINYQYLLELGESFTQEGEDDNLSTVVAVDQKGTAKIQKILEHPSDRTFLSNVNERITTARWRPASENGHAVESYMVLMFSKISVYD